jgi:hypothetical protein
MAQIPEFEQYIFQLLARLLELGADPAPSLPMLPTLCGGVLWQLPGNIPPLTRLLQAFILRVRYLVSFSKFWLAVTVSKASHSTLTDRRPRPCSQKCRIS